MSTILITGVSGNLGQAVAKKFTELNYHVRGTVIPNDPAKIDITDEKFSTAVADLMDESSAEKFVSDFLSEHTTIDALVCTVGGFAMGAIEKTSLADVSKQIKLNFDTAYNVARPVFLQMMKQGRGRIFLIGSRPGSAMSNSKGMVAYGMAKSLLFRLAELMNAEAKGTNVVVSVIVPSTIDTPQNRKSMPDTDPANWVKPEAIADVIAFYCSDAAQVIKEPVIKVYNNS